MSTYGGIRPGKAVRAAGILTKLGSSVEEFYSGHRAISVRSRCCNVDLCTLCERGVISRCGDATGWEAYWLVV